MLMSLFRSCFPLSPFKLLKLVRYLKYVQANNVEAVDKRAGSFFTEDFTYVVGGKSRISGVCGGWPEYRDKIILGEVSTPGEIVDICSNWNSITLIVRLRGERKGKTLDQKVAFYFTFKNGKIDYGQSLPFDIYAWDEFWE
jgi:hypothetical protein